MICPKLSGANAFVRYVLSNWQASAIESLRSGSMLMVVKGNSLARGQGTWPDRAQTVPGVNWQLSGLNRNQEIKAGYFNLKPILFGTEEFPNC